MGVTSSTGPSAYAPAMMAFQTGKKFAGVADLLWFFIGGLDVHARDLGAPVDLLVMERRAFLRCMKA